MNSKDVKQKELETILKFGALVNSSLNIEDVLNHAMLWAEEFINAEASSVYELDEESGELFVRIARGEKKTPAKQIKLKVGEGIAGIVVQSGQPKVVQNVREERRFNDQFDKKTGFKTRSMICVPLINRNKPLGALQVLNKKSGKTFSQEDLELLTMMAQQIAVALENAKLYNRLEKKFELTTKELKQVQEKLIRSERLAAMGHLVQGVAHEIRNPITTIGGFAQRAKQSVEENPKLNSYMDIILEEAERLENIVKDVREFSNVITANVVPDDLTPVLTNVWKHFEPIAEAQQVSMSRRIEKDLPLIRIDKNQIGIALSNVIDNAFESMPDGGQLTLEVRPDEEKIQIRIVDSGLGIPQDDLDSIYDPFFTSKTRGAGLGLTMVHQIVMNHNGEIKIHSNEGEGTSVTLQIPINI